MVLICPNCHEELDLPDDAVGAKVQCFYCATKFFATVDFIKNQPATLTVSIPAAKLFSPDSESQPEAAPATPEVQPEAAPVAEAEPLDAKAQYELGLKYYYGKDVGKDLPEAFKWIRKAAEQGYADAQNDLAVGCFHGLGAAADQNEAFKWYRRAAEQGHKEAQYALAVCYAYGKGVGQDYSNSVFWFGKAAEQGKAEAMYCLGICHGNGYGVVKNADEAMKWFRKAADGGNEAARKLLESPADALAAAKDLPSVTSNELCGRV